MVGAVDAIVHMSEDGMTVAGRAIEETSIPLNRMSNGAWDLADKHKIKQQAIELLNDGRYPSQRDKARELARLSSRPEATCLSIIHRLQKASETA